MSDFTADEIRILKALAAGIIGASPVAAQHAGEVVPLADHQLENDWANKIVSKDPRRWTGESMVGRRYSDCSAEWHDSMAGLCEFKAQKGREETPVRLKNNGRPWHESDAFEAKLCRAWARRIRATRGGAAAATDAAEPAADSETLDPSIPF